MIAAERFGDKLTPPWAFVHRRGRKLWHIAGRSYGRVTTLCIQDFDVWNAKHQLSTAHRKRVCRPCFLAARTLELMP